MNLNWKSFALAAMVVVGCVGLGASPARAQGYSFGFSTPGFSLGVSQGPYGYYGGGYYPGYPVVRPGPVVVAPAVPYVVPRPIYGPRPLYGPPVVYGPRVYGGGFRGAPFYYGRRW